MIDEGGISIWSGYKPHQHNLKWLAESECVGIWKTKIRTLILVDCRSVLLSFVCKTIHGETSALLVKKNIRYGGILKIVVDQESGVHYLASSGIGISGMTPLLDEDGNSIIKHT